MAREVTYSCSLNAGKNGARITHAQSKTLDMAGNELLQATQLIGTGAELLTFGDIAGAPGVVLFVNLDATNYVEVDSANTFDKFPQKLMPGDSILLRPQTGNIYARANTAACRCLKVATEA